MLGMLAPPAGGVCNFCLSQSWTFVPSDPLLPTPLSGFARNPAPCRLHFLGSSFAGFHQWEALGSRERVRGEQNVDISAPPPCQRMHTVSQTASFPLPCLHPPDALCGEHFPLPACSGFVPWLISSCLANFWLDLSSSLTSVTSSLYYKC